MEFNCRKKAHTFAPSLKILGSLSLSRPLVSHLPNNLHRPVHKKMPRALCLSRVERRCPRSAGETKDSLGAGAAVKTAQGSLVSLLPLLYLFFVFLSLFFPPSTHRAFCPRFYKAGSGGEREVEARKEHSGSRGRRATNGFYSAQVLRFSPIGWFGIRKGKRRSRSKKR